MILKSQFIIFSALLATVGASTAAAEADPASLAQATTDSRICPLLPRDAERRVYARGSAVVEFAFDALQSKNRDDLVAALTRLNEVLQEITSFPLTAATPAFVSTYTNKINEYTVKVTTALANAPVHRPVPIAAEAAAVYIHATEPEVSAEKMVNRKGLAALDIARKALQSKNRDDLVDALTKLNEVLQEITSAPLTAARPDFVSWFTKRINDDIVNVTEAIARLPAPIAAAGALRPAAISAVELTRAAQVAAAPQAGGDAVAEEDINRIFKYLKYTTYINNDIVKAGAAAQADAEGDFFHECEESFEDEPEEDEILGFQV